MTSPKGKLIAIGGAVEEESFEVQAKVHLDSDLLPLAALAGGRLRVIRSLAGPF